MSPRATVRRPVSGSDLYDAIQMLTHPKHYRRADRLAARALVRKAAKYVRKHIPKDRRTTIHEDVLDFHYALMRGKA